MKTLLLLGLILLTPGGAWAQVWPSPPNPLVLPVPDGKSLEFVPVFLGVKDPLLATVEFTSGTPGTTPEEAPTISTVGGTFRSGAGTEGDWFYYMGTTEVTREVFNAVLRSAGLPEKSFPEGEATLPATGLSWFEVQNFLRAYNAWLAREGSLPEPLAGGKAFVRLPTESEWEFAARGGTTVSRTDFDRRTPYGEEDITLFEWAAGPASSHHKLNPVRRLRPNPLGLYDMLGNAAEMTASVFQIEPGQGPVGGLVQRGGTYRTRAEEMRSSLRGEFSPYTEEGLEAALPWLGFRLVLGSIVYSDIERVQEIREGWETYRTRRIVPRPGSDRLNPASDTISREAGQALETPPGAALEATERLREQVRDLEAEKNRYEARSVETLVRWCSQNAHILGKNSALLGRVTLDRLTGPLHARLQLLRQMPAAGKEERATLDLLEGTLKNFAENRLAQLERERDLAGEVYLEALPLLAEMDPHLVAQAFDQHIVRLVREPDAQTQAATTRAAYAQLLEFARHRKIAYDRWRDELARAYSESL